jgi:hypothetical protein
VKLSRIGEAGDSRRAIASYRGNDRGEISVYCWEMKCAVSTAEGATWMACSTGLDRWRCF